MVRDGHRSSGADGEAGQAALFMLGVLAVVLAGVLVLFGFGQALGAKGRHQRAADLAAISAAQAMRELYPRLFEPPYIEPDVPNPRHLEESEYRAAARAGAIRGARRNRRRDRCRGRHISGVGLRADAGNGEGPRRSRLR